MYVMETDIHPGRIAPPGTGPATSRVSAATLAEASQDDTRAYLEQILGGLGAPAVFSSQDLAGDGSPAVDSVVATWLIRQVGDIVGKVKLVNLAKIRHADLLSTAGLARIVRGALEAASLSALSQ